MEDIMVSIYCITYNHVGIIDKCLNGFISQNTNFRYEVWIHDDHSTDGTAEILSKYEKEYSDIIHVVYEDENLYSRGISIYDRMKDHLTGKYIAICEGDDYWTDPYKLQKQFNFMEQNSDVSICVHGAIQLNLETERQSLYPLKPSRSGFISTEDIIVYGGGYFPTCSFFSRNDFKFISRRWGSGFAGDFSRILQCSLHGKVYFFRENMAIKTFLYPGSWAATHRNQELMKQHLQDSINSIRLFDNDTNYCYHEAVERRISLYLYQMRCMIDGNYRQLFTDKEYKPILAAIPWTVKIRCFLLAYCSIGYKLYQSIRSFSSSFSTGRKR